ncbi:MAG TPA: pseudouridine synthase, partial [Roseiflexaceae bacterium]|nr:pseudouridine synthase [Roseiflexaceae bacterium]
MSPERLQKVLASAGIASRRDCEELIGQGRVAVNGKEVRVPGTRVDPDTDEITVDGEPIGRISPRTYIMLHKPAGVISTTDDPQGRPTVVDVVQTDARLFPVGRLDFDSEGLLLLTDDGELTQRLTHPSHQIEKEYRVLLNEAPSPDALREWRDGVLLDGVETAPAWVEVLDRSGEGTWIRVVLHEGRKRQIREVAKLLGYDVLRLIRVREGPLLLGDLETGAWRALTEAEVEALNTHATEAEREQVAEERRAERARVRRVGRPSRVAAAEAPAAAPAPAPQVAHDEEDHEPQPHFNDDRRGYRDRPRRDDRGGNFGPRRDDRGGNFGPRRDDRGGNFGPRRDARGGNFGPRRDDRGGNFGP